MKHLRQYIRRVLLAEAAKGVEDLDDHYTVEVYDDGLMVKFRLLRLPYRTETGKIVIVPNANHTGPCGGAWKVSSSEVRHGWGPFLYDVAMEYATLNGGGLIADRDSVSREARQVWQYYMQNRGDVIAHQLDDPKNTLTPTDEDNCDQEVAGGFTYMYSRSEEPENKDWAKSPLSKRYTKAPTTINRLKELGILVEI